MIFWPVLYFVMFVYYLTKAYYFVHSAPWEGFKIANLLIRLHVCLPMSCKAYPPRPACDHCMQRAVNPHSW